MSTTEHLTHDDPSGDGLPGADAAAPPDDAVVPPGLEAVLFLADEPVEVAALAEVLDRDPEQVESCLRELRDEYARRGGGIEIRHAAGGWRMYTAAAARPVLERWALAGRTGRLTQAALETLAVVAYKQPISRQEISDVRGVNADAAVRNLVARGFVRDVGRDEGPGQALLYGTTRLFLERLGLDSLDELPPLTDFLPEAPAPDEPELGALKEVRRRLAAGDELPTGRSHVDARTNTGPDGAHDDGVDDALPPPRLRAGGGRGDADMDALTDRLEHAARGAVDRLRQAVAAGESDPAAGDAEDAERGDGVATDGREDGEHG